MSIAPVLTVRHGAAAVEFYKKAFNAVETHRVEDPTGAIVCRLNVDGAEFWVHDGEPQTGRMILSVDDPRAVFTSAIAAGATEVHPVGEQYGWLLGRVTDPYGYDWEIGKEF